MAPKFWRSPIGLATLSASWFFLVLTSYYLLKPLRDGLASSLSNRLGDLYLGTFLTTMVALAGYSKLVSRVRRFGFVFSVYQFFVLCLIAFFVMLRSNETPPSWLIASFFIWVSVFNIFSTTMFWSVMADLYSPMESKQWFGWIASGGSIGSLCGSGMAVVITQWLGESALLIVSLLFLELAVGLAFALESLRPTTNGDRTESNLATNPADAPCERQTMLNGLMQVFRSKYLLLICGFIVLGKFGSTFVYNSLQVVMLAEIPDKTDRVDLFARMNLFVQGGSLFLQAVVAGWLMSRWGLRTALVAPTVIVVGIFLSIALDSTLGVSTLTLLVFGQVIQQWVAYGILVPAQNALFSVVSHEEKYKSKAFMDTVIFRGSDVLAGKVCQFIGSQGYSLAWVSGALLPLMVLWGFVAGLVGTRFQKLSQQEAK